jgi:hypothetical protein
MTAHIPNIIKLGKTHKYHGVLLGGDHIVLSLKVERSTMGTPIGASNM